MKAWIFRGLLAGGTAALAAIVEFLTSPESEQALAELARDGGVIGILVGILAAILGRFVGGSRERATD